MKMALKEAKKAFLISEVPVGAVLVKDDVIIARGHNVVEKKQSVLRHAELEVIKKANAKQKNWRLNETTLYVTLEPCMMCLGAINLSRIKNVIFLLLDDKKSDNQRSIERKNIVTTLILHSDSKRQKEYKTMLQTFFRDQRILKKFDSE